MNYITTVLTALVAFSLPHCSGSHIVGDAGYDVIIDSTMESDEGEETGVACGECDDLDPCTTDSCDHISGECINEPLDADNDGYESMLAPDGVTSCPGDDCDDNDDTVYPGAPEVCMDGIDQDCDTLIDGPRSMHGELHVKSISDDDSYSSLIWTGTEYGILWHEAGSLNLSRITMDGIPIGDPMEVIDTHEHISQSSMIWSGSEYAIVYEHWLTSTCSTSPIFCPRQIEFTTLDETGAVVVPPLEIVDVDNRVTAPDISWTGSQFGVVWRDHRDGSCGEYGPCEYEFYYTQISALGEEIGSERRISYAVGEAVAHRETLLWSGSEFALAWKDVQEAHVDYYLTRFTSFGSVIGEDCVLENPVQSIVWMDGQYGVTWDDDNSGDWYVKWGRLTPSGELSTGPVPISNVPNTGAYPRITAYGSSSAIAWLDGRNRDCSPRPYEWLGDCHQDIYFSVLDADGITAWEDTRITTNDSWKLWLDMVWTGSEFGITWSEYTEEPEETWRINFDIISFCD